MQPRDDGHNPVFYSGVSLISGDEDNEMTTVDVCFRYAGVPGEAEMVALAKARDVYGIRKISFEDGSVVRVEYDASRLNDENVLAMLRGSGIEVLEKLALI